MTRMRRKGSPFALLVGIQTGADAVETNMKILQKIKSGSASQSSYPTSGNVSEGTQNSNLKEQEPPYVHEVLFTLFTLLPRYGSSPSVHQ